MPLPPGSDPRAIEWGWPREDPPLADRWFVSSGGRKRERWDRGLAEVSVSGVHGSYGPAAGHRWRSPLSYHRAGYSASPPTGLLPSGGRVGRPALLRSAPEIFSAIADALQGGLQSASRFSSSLRRTGVPLATE